MAIEQIDWLSKALEMFPELSWRFEDLDIHPMSFWIELNCALVLAYEKKPIDNDLIGRIYSYASWCFDQPGANSAETNLGTAVVVCFIEHLPESPAVAGDLYRWMSSETFDGFESVFRYHLSDEQFLNFRNSFMHQKRTYSGKSIL